MRNKIDPNIVSCGTPEETAGFYSTKMLQSMLIFYQKFQFYIIFPVIENVVQNQTSGGFFAFAKNRWPI